MPPERRVVLGTRNPHKVREMARLLEPAKMTLEPLPDGIELPPETGDTFEANALPKARTAALATGCAAIADDSGIEAEALGGAPGVRSARFAGADAGNEENLRKLMAEVRPGSRLRYVCALAYVDPRDGTEHVLHGYCEGSMAERRRGSGGFGYDPVFLPDGDLQGRTMAELSDLEKDAISHRGNAVRAFIEWLAR